jgi:hypothetical protein
VRESIVGTRYEKLGVVINGPRKGRRIMRIDNAVTGSANDSA